MSGKEFVMKFGIFSSICLLLILVTHLGSALSTVLTFSLSTLVLYVALTVLMFLFAKKARMDSNPGSYTSTLLSFHWIRIFTSLLFVFSYITISPQKSNLFLLPFFSIYILFTIFEVYMLTKLESDV